MTLLHVGEEHRAVLLKRADRSPEPLQLALDPCELGHRSPMPMVAIVVGALHERLKLAPEEPQPWIPVNDTDSILELTRVNRSLDLALGQSELLAGRLVSQLAPFRRQSSSTGCFLPARPPACNLTLPSDGCPT